MNALYSTCEVELVQRLKNNNKEALTTVFTKYTPLLYSVLYKITKDEHITQDLLQEVFIKIWNKSSQYDIEKGSMVTWMTNIAKNTAIDNIRAVNRGMKVKGNNILEDKYPDCHTATSTEKIGIVHLINKMKPQYAKIVVMVYYRGYTLKDAATELNMPLGTVKTWLKYALTSLRQDFNYQADYE